MPDTSDAFRPQDFAPEGRGMELPMRARFYQELSNVVVGYEGQVIDAMREEFGEDHASKLRRALDNRDEYGKSVYNFAYPYNPSREKLSISGADEVELEFMGMPDVTDSIAPNLDKDYITIGLFVYKDGSPYVPDEMFERGYENNIFWVMVSPNAEEPPFIVFVDDYFAHVDKDLAPKDGKLSPQTKGVLQYKQDVETEGYSLPALSDQECERLLEIIKAAELDLAPMLREMKYAVRSIESRD